MAECSCQTPPFNYLDFDVADLGPDAGHGEVSLQTCRKCGMIWVKYLIEEEQRSRSGRWWRARIAKDDSRSLTAENALNYIEKQEWCFVGGSFYAQGIHTISRPIKVQ